jgi:hypothetical protein
MNFINKLKKHSWLILIILFTFCSSLSGLTIYLLLTQGFNVLTIILLIISLLSIMLFITSYILMHKQKQNINVYLPHQNEPDSWQCSCGRYNTAMRSICLSCKKSRYDNDNRFN